MKLISLKINKKFRSLQKGFEINFHNADDPDLEQFHPFCFAGLNGSGKSNVLEALASIFYHLQSCTLKFMPKEFKDDFLEEKCDPDAFELEYLIVPKYEKKINRKPSLKQLVKVRIYKEENQKPKISISEDWQTGNNQNNQYDDVIQPAKGYLPELLIGYSSGENEILSLPFFKSRFIHFDEYAEYLSKNYRNYNQPESGLLYIDYSMSQAVLLANFLVQPDQLLDPIKNVLEIEDIKEFRLVFYHRKLNNKPILALLDKTITKLKKCCSSWYFDNEKNITYIDYYITAETKSAFRSNFKNNPFEVFRAFQILLTLNLYYVEEKAPGLKKVIYNSESLYVEEKVLQPSTEEHVFYFNNFYIKTKKSKDPILLKSLSDGEHQFLHTMGICLMLQGVSSLLLLDEPETHFNPDWRSKFIYTLKECLSVEQNKSLMQDILITSHSPFIISDCGKEKVKWFKKDEIGATIIPLDFETYGASIDFIHKRLFNKELISKDAFKQLEKLINEGTLDELIKGVEQFGESSQKQFLFRKIYEKSNIEQNPELK